jgi:hypothetical protein
MIEVLTYLRVLSPHKVAFGMPSVCIWVCVRMNMRLASAETVERIVHRVSI